MEKENMRTSVPMEGLTLETSVILAVKNGRISESITLLANKELKDAGYELTFEQALVVFLLNFYDGLTQRDIAISLDKDSPSITRLIDELEGLKMLERRSDPNDRRAKNIYLTSKGKGVVPGIIDVTKVAFKKAFKGISDD
ncbi:MAG: MarR family transcriptional regulator, partial [Paludibacteraceae bacterium]|nr:MarR family transcriptional regulator [Paludibacteraceae bacterium]